MAIRLSGAVALTALAGSAVLAAAGGAVFASPARAASQVSSVLPAKPGRLGSPRVVNLSHVAGRRAAAGAHPPSTLRFLPAPRGSSGNRIGAVAPVPVLSPSHSAVSPKSARVLTTATSSPEDLTAFSAASLNSDVGAFGSDQSVAPPDTQVAAGPSYLVEPVNSTLWVWSKGGTAYPPTDLNVFFSVPSGYSFTDPRVAYDAGVGRWFLSGLSVDSAYDSQTYVAVSETSDPNGNWYVYTVSSESGVVQDQPKLGFDSSVVVLSWNDYSGPSTFTGQETWVLNQSDLLSGAAVYEASFGPDPSRFDVVPAISLTSTTTAYAAYNNSCGSNTTGSCNTGSSAIGVVSLTGVPPNQVSWNESDPSISPTSSPPAADQPGAPASIATDDDRFLAVTYDGGTLYVSGNDACIPAGDTATRPCARVIEVSLAGTTPSVTLDEDIGSAGADIYYPAVVPDRSGNLFIAATLSSTSVYAEAIGLVQPPGSSSVTMDVFQSGAGTYSYSTCSSSSFNGCRWGDYSGAAVDPANPTDVWLAAEYAPTTGSDWGTAIGEFTLSPPTVTGVSPATGSTSGGTSVTVQGSNFAQGASVDFGAIAASSVVVVSPTELTAVSPPDATVGPVNVTVTTADGTSAITSADQFTYGTPPTVTAVSPDFGATSGGTVVTITGSDFSGATAVHFGSTAAKGFTVGSATSITAVSPAEAPGAVDVTVTTPYGTSASSSADLFTYVLDAYHSLPPTRLLDTRQTGQTLGPNSRLELTVVGGSVPSSATAVALNVTVTNTTTSSYLSVFPTGQPQPVLSNLNWRQGETVPNLVIVPVGANGQVTFYNYAGKADVIADLEGYFAAETPGTTAGSYVPLSPSRIADTRTGSGEPYAGQTLGPGVTLNVQVDGQGLVPTTGVTAALLNVTVTNTTASSYLTVYPQGGTRPVASNLNWTPGDTVANRVVVPVNPSTGQISVYNYSGSTDVIVDVDGYFTAGGSAPSNASLFGPISPVRVLDTRKTGQALGPGSILPVTLSGVDGIPVNATAVVTNVTATNTTAASYFTVYPGGVRPLASDVNWQAGQTVPNLTVATLSSTGEVDVYNHAGSAALIIDAFGYFSPG